MEVKVKFESEKKNSSKFKTRLKLKQKLYSLKNHVFCSQYSTTLWIRRIRTNHAPYPKDVFLAKAEVNVWSVVEEAILLWKKKHNACINARA